jgi:hypothetical protein
VREHGPALALDHEVPHGWNRLDSAAFIGNLSVVGDEVEFPPPVAEAALLDFMAAHKEAH